MAWQVTGNACISSSLKISLLQGDPCLGPGAVCRVFDADALIHSLGKGQLLCLWMDAKTILHYMKSNPRASWEKDSEVFEKIMLLFSSELTSFHLIFKKLSVHGKKKSRNRTKKIRWNCVWMGFGQFVGEELQGDRRAEDQKLGTTDPKTWSAIGWLIRPANGCCIRIGTTTWLGELVKQRKRVTPQLSVAKWSNWKTQSLGEYWGCSMGTANRCPWSWADRSLALRAFGMAKRSNLAKRKSTKR
jgi:hypothetical protein